METTIIQSIGGNRVMVQNIKILAVSLAYILF